MQIASQSPFSSNKDVRHPALGREREGGVFMAPVGDIYICFFIYVTRVGDFHNVYAYPYMCLFSLMCLHVVCRCMIYMNVCLRMLFHAFIGVCVILCDRYAYL